MKRRRVNPLYHEPKSGEILQCRSCKRKQLVPDDAPEDFMSQIGWHLVYRSRGLVLDLGSAEWICPFCWSPTGEIQRCTQ